MAPTSIREAIDWIGACPTLGPQQKLMIRILTKNERAFDNVSLQFTVSMFMQLNVIADDGFHGIRGPEQEQDRWFTLAPHDDGLALCLGDGMEILGETILPEDGAGDLIREGIEHITDMP